MYKISGYKRLTLLPKDSDIEQITYRIPIQEAVYPTPETGTHLDLAVFKEEGFLKIIFLDTDTCIIINFDNELEFHEAHRILEEFRTDDRNEIEIPVYQLIQSKGMFDTGNPYDIGISRVLLFEDEDVIITDPCYIMKDRKNPDSEDEWVKCNCGSNLEAFGITKYDTRSTIWGDWFCSIINKDSGEIIGHFSADSGLVSVINYNQVLKYNPEVAKMGLEESESATILRGYTGRISIKTRYVYGEYSQWERFVEGQGSINFGSLQ